MGLRYPSLTFFAKMSIKTLKICYKVSSSKIFQRQSCSAINYLSKGINILARGDPLSVKIGPKGIDPNRKDACFTFHMRNVGQSALVLKEISV